MYLLNNITNDTKQNIEWISPSGNSIYLHLEYLPNQLGWFLSFKYKDNEFKNIRITTTKNMLRVYRTYLPFGIMCKTTDEGEPLGINDFASGYAQIYILTRQECKTLEDNYYVKV